MTKTDYIRQVDAMDLPDGLRQRLGALPETRGTRRAEVVAPYKGRETRAHIVRPYGRWAAIAATLVLVVGLGVAAPAIFRFFTTGGDVVTPPSVATTSSVPDPVGIVNQGIDVSETVLDAAKEYVQEQYRHFARLHGERPGVPTPAFYDNWRIEGITAAYEGKRLGEYTASVYRLDYRLHTTTPEIVRNYLVGGIDLDEEGWLLPTYPDSTYLVFILNYSTPHHFVTMINDCAPGSEQFDQNIQAGIESFLASSEEAPAISDEALTELLAAEIPLERHQQDTWKLLGSSVSPEGRTLGVLQYEWAGSDGTPDSTTNWSNLLLGVYDNATRELTGPVIRVNGHLTYALPYSTGSGGQDYYVLCVGSNHGQGIAENFNVALYYFDGMELKQVSTSPNAVLPEGTEDMFDPLKNGDFWKDNNHKIVLAPGGFELFERNPAWDSSPYRAGVDPWRYMGYVPLAYKYPDPAALEGARRFYEDYYTGSSYYSFQLCELVPGYEDIDYPNAHAYHVVLDVGQDAVMDRYFLFDEDGTLLGTRSIPEGSLTIDGVSYALGIHTRNIFGTPVKTNLIPSTGRKSDYSEWFSPNANACGYTYYPATGEYRLSSISTIREDAYTARGIHVGSTVAEVIAAYPEADKEFSTQANYLSYYGPGFTIEFYFSTSLSREEMLKQTVTSINLSAEFW